MSLHAYGLCHCSPALCQVPHLTNMSLLHYLFAICMFTRMYVTRQGHLVGVLYKVSRTQTRNCGVRRPPSCHAPMPAWRA